MLSAEPATAATQDSGLSAEHWGGVGLAGLAVAFFSTSAVFVRLAAPISPYEITFWRMVVAAATAGGGMLMLRKARPFPLERRYILFGLIAALHFLLFVTSLSFTSIAHSLSITYLAPVFTALASWRWLGEKLSARQACGVALALIGLAVLVGLQPRMTGSMLLGDGLALLSALCYAAYSIAGRSERRHYGLLPYATAVYSVAALWLIPALIAGFLTRPGGPSVYSTGTVLALLGAGVLPLGLGHTFYNASLRRIPATYANLIASQEVTGGVALGAIFLGEVPSLNSMIGAALAIVGIVLVLVEG